jgi:feruloyl-CoA synthase
MVKRSFTELFAPAAVECDRRTGGAVHLRSPQPLDRYARCVGEWLVQWARESPNRVFLTERGDSGEWRGVSYAQALDQVRRISSWLLHQDVSEERPLAILSDNSVEHGLLTLAALHVGVPVVPISPAYSLISKEFGKLRDIFTVIRPGLVYVADVAQFGPALRAVCDLFNGRVIAGRESPISADTIPFSELLKAKGDSAVDAAFARIRPDTIAKLLFTSGSTGRPKGVINTQRMLCANQQQMAQVWLFTSEAAPVIVDWLPWNHTFGGNHDFNLALRAGGTLYIDEGRPTPTLFERTMANLREVAPTVYFNVPRGYEMLVSALRVDRDLRLNFFSRLQMLLYAAAALPQHLWEALKTMAREVTGEEIALVSAWGSTETAPLATCCHFPAERAGVVGLPVPGCELKLVPRGPKLEARVRGPQVTPGYWKQAELTAQAFDDEGYYKIGDAVRFVDETHPELGLLFDGRVSEDFKLLTGTWVNTGGLRLKALAHLNPLVQDIVVAGHDRNEIGLLLFPNVIECKKLCPEVPEGASIDVILMHPSVRAEIHQRLSKLRREGTGSSTYAGRALMMAAPPSADAGEITDKGYINQSVVLDQRKLLVKLLYAPQASDVVMVIAP